MKKLLLTVILAVLLIGIYYFVNSTKLWESDFVEFDGVGIIYENDCLSKTSICKIEVLSNTESQSSVRVSYNYIKGLEDHNRLFLVANKGKFDNKVGVDRAYTLSEGMNTLDVMLGLHRSAPDFRASPYESSYLSLKVKGVDKVNNLYIDPELINLTLDFKRSWYKPLSK